MSTPSDNMTPAQIDATPTPVPPPARMFWPARILRKFNAWRKLRDWSRDRATARFIVNRAEESSTWKAGIVALMTLTGASIAPAKVEAITLVGMTMATLISMETREKYPNQGPIFPPNTPV